MPRRMRRAALCSALSVKAGNGDIIVIDEVIMDAAKTKDMVAFVNNHAAGKSALLLLAEADENVERSARNLTDVKTLRASYLNIRDLLGYDKILMPLAALDVVTEIFVAEFPVDEVGAGMEEEE